jgi:hypothetical protein
MCKNEKKKTVCPRIEFQLKLPFQLLKSQTGFGHITKFKMKNFQTLTYHAWVFRSLNFDIRLNYVQKTAQS